MLVRLRCQVLNKCSLSHSSYVCTLYVPYKHLVDLENKGLYTYWAYSTPYLQYINFNSRLLIMMHNMFDVVKYVFMERLSAM